MNLTAAERYAKGIETTHLDFRFDFLGQPQCERRRNKGLIAHVFDINMSITADIHSY
jgi:hypothetical protein